MVEMSSTASANVSGSDNMEVLGNMSTSAGIEFNEDINMPEGLDTFESEEEKLIVTEPVKESSSLGLIIGLSLGSIVIILAVYFLVIKKKKVVQKTL